MTTVTHADFSAATLVGTITRKQAAELVRVLGMNLADDVTEYAVRIDVQPQYGDKASQRAMQFRVGSSLFGADITITDSVIHTITEGA
jgi:hypothetical protein